MKRYAAALLPFDRHKDTLQDLRGLDVYQDEMKTNLLLIKRWTAAVAAVLIALVPLLASAQNPVFTANSASAQGFGGVSDKFDLDFPGGTPQQLVKTIEASSGQRLNAIIPAEFEDVKLPALKMRQVTADDLFKGLELASQRTITYATASIGFGARAQRQYSTARTGVGFRRIGNVWVFYHEKPAIPNEPQASRFYHLEPYLKTYKVGDIITAIRTAWKMLGEAKEPTLSFHEETKLLIAVGSQEQLQVIDDALAALRPGPERRDPQSAEAKPDAPQKPSEAKPSAQRE